MGLLILTLGFSKQHHLSWEFVFMVIFVIDRGIIMLMIMKSCSWQCKSYNSALFKCTFMKMKANFFPQFNPLICTKAQHDKLIT